ncbi:MAG TPA: hypothetical protein VGJ14_07710 [Sporichthyaceae bacterium]|jgi:hypothetical protein
MTSEIIDGRIERRRGDALLVYLTAARDHLAEELRTRPLMACGAINARRYPDTP